MIKIVLAAIAILIIITLCASTGVAFTTHAAATNPLVCDTPDADCLEMLDILGSMFLITAILAVGLVTAILTRK